MKKIFILLLVFALAGGILSACQTAAPDTGKPEAGGSTVGKGIAYNKLTFEEISDMGTLPADIAAGIEGSGHTRGYAYFKLDDAFIVSINSGERNTGGYSIKVKSVEDIEGITKITVEETAPAKDAIVTEALTYPKTVIKIKGAAENFQVVDVSGGVFGLLTVAGSAKQIDSEGVYSGQIDNNSIEIYVDGKPGAFRIDSSFETVINSLKKDDKVSLSYFTNEYGQQILTKLEKK